MSPSWQADSLPLSHSGSPNNKPSVVQTGTYSTPVVLIWCAREPVLGFMDGGGLVTKSCLTLLTPWTIARQPLLSMGFPRQKYWSGLPFPSPGIVPTRELNLRLLCCRMSLTLKVDSLLLSPQGRLGFIFFIYKNRMRGLTAEFLMSFCSTTLWITLFQKIGSSNIMVGPLIICQ